MFLKAENFYSEHFPRISKEETLREKCPNMEFFWSVFSRIWSEYGDLLLKSAYSVQVRENKDQKNAVFGQFLPSEPWQSHFCIK